MGAFQDGRVSPGHVTCKDSSLFDGNAETQKTQFPTFNKTFEKDA